MSQLSSLSQEATTTNKQKHRRPLHRNEIIIFVYALCADKLKIAHDFH